MRTLFSLVLNAALNFTKVKSVSMSCKVLGRTHHLEQARESLQVPGSSILLKFPDPTGHLRSNLTIGVKLALARPCDCVRMVVLTLLYYSYRLLRIYANLFLHAHDQVQSGTVV